MGGVCTVGCTRKGLCYGGSVYCRMYEERIVLCEELCVVRCVSWHSLRRPDIGQEKVY